jgi:hypothetical protein
MKSRKIQQYQKHQKRRNLRGEVQEDPKRNQMIQITQEGEVKEIDFIMVGIVWVKQMSHRQ